MMHHIKQWATMLENHPGVAAGALAAAGLAVVVIALVIRWIARAIKSSKVTGDQVGTLFAAAIATGVSAQGMWVFFDKSLQLPIPLRVMFFAFLEIMVVSSALRARAAQLHGGSAGVDGIAMWVLTCLSAVLAATDAANIGTVLIRLSAPLVAAWGWERSMALERRRRTGARGGINWRFTPERLMVRWGLADPVSRTIGDAAAQRRSINVALAADHARTVRNAGASERKVRQAKQKLHRAMRLAVEDGGLVPAEGRTRQAILLDYISILYNTTALLDLEPPNPWTASDDIDREFRELVSPDPPDTAPVRDNGFATRPVNAREPVRVRSAGELNGQSVEDRSTALPHTNGHHEPNARPNGHREPHARPDEPSRNGNSAPAQKAAPRPDAAPRREQAEKSRTEHETQETSVHTEPEHETQELSVNAEQSQEPAPSAQSTTRRALNPFPEPIDPEQAAMIAQAVRVNGWSTKPLEILIDLYVRVSAGEVPAQVAADLGLPRETANRALRAAERAQ